MILQAYLEYEPVSGNVKLELSGSTQAINLMEVGAAGPSRLETHHVLCGFIFHAW
jgi:hypothetical protein